METTVQQIIDALTAPATTLEHTVDKLLFGAPDAVVRGIAVVFMPTQQAIERAAALGASFIIAHEGPFYSHHDTFAAALEEDPVYSAKTSFIEQSGLSLFRLHDYIHRYEPDGITEGLLQTLGWQPYVTATEPTYSVVEVPAMTAMQIAAHVKERLELSHVRMSGEPEALCRRIGLMAGYRGVGAHAIPLIERQQLDLVLYGEGPEWETPEYVRDAAWQGRAKAAIALGHAESEVCGMRLLAERLQRQFPELPVHFVANEPLFRLV
ncbi:Nif3-like dinuclear metal center hexameric protein [Paenibacillus sp. PL2-23]|uniref:Nif3-like dinuclear metal center hexameric protein n=1 Tax=Paenibacillus sp. PL2-23 TaxID=2100729 RepID=UPI0030F8F5BA